MRRFQATVAVGEQQFRMMVQRPEAPQCFERGLRQQHETITVALGVANVHPLPLGDGDDVGQPLRFGDGESDSASPRVSSEHRACRTLDRTGRA